MMSVEEHSTFPQKRHSALKIVKSIQSGYLPHRNPLSPFPRDKEFKALRHVFYMKAGLGNPYLSKVTVSS